MLTQEQIQAVKAPFPPEALSADMSRGFELTSIKAAQAPGVIKRLNEVFLTEWAVSLTHTRDHATAFVVAQ